MSKNGRATEAALDALHAKVADVLTKALDGDDISPQMIAQALKYLRDNGIDAPATSERFDGLMKALEDLDLDDAATQMPN